MNDYILETIGLADPSAEPFDVQTINNCKYIHIRKKTSYMQCPVCGQRMKSKGWQKERTVKGIGSIGGYHILLVLHQKKWYCPHCNTYATDQFSFVDPFCHSSNLLPYLIANDMRDLSVTAVQLAEKYSVSDTFVIQQFLSVVCLNRLPLPDILCIDEVYLNFDHTHKYPMVLLDFRTGEPIDIVSSRRKEVSEDYFLSIPYEERKQVKFLISDMYDSYIRLAGTVFPNAVNIVDSFHVVARLNSRIISYINAVKRRYQERDRKKLAEENYRNNRNNKSRKDSSEVMLLKNYDWILLSNDDHIEYTTTRKYVPALAMFLDTYDLINAYMKLDGNFRYIREMKEKYIAFNNSHANDSNGAAAELDLIIEDYSQARLSMFREFAELLKKYRKEIIASFTCIEVKHPKTGNTILRRLSNGPAESFNNFPKDLKRNSNGVRNFEYARTRILWARRTNPSVLAVPRTLQEIHTEGKKRGPYNK